MTILKKIEANEGCGSIDNLSDKRKERKMIDIQTRFLEFISRVYMVDSEEIELNDSLIAQGIIDSFGLIEISVFLENEFSIEITEEDMIRDNFGSVLKIVSFVERQLNK